MASYPWLAFSEATREIQREINTRRVAEDKACPILVEDGKLGPATCSAVKVYSTRSGTIASVLPSCKSYNDAAIASCLVLPWMQPSLETITFQRALNSLLVPQGYCKIKEDGVLGPETCGAAQQILGATFSKVGCQSGSMLKVCAAASSPTQPVSPLSPVVTAPAAPEVAPSAILAPLPAAETIPASVTTEPSTVVIPAVPPEAEEQEVLVQGSRASLPPPPKKSSAIWWIVGGLAAVGAVGVYTMKKKRGKRG